MRVAHSTFLVGLVVVVVLLAGSGTARADLVVGGKAVLPGAWAVPYGQGGSPAGKSVFGDGDLVYDTEIQVYVLYSGSAPVPLQVSLEQYDPGTITQYVNQTQGNATTLVPVEVPARLNAQWSNQSATLVPGQLTILTVPVPAASTERHLQLTVGNAAWSLMHLTPTGSSLAGDYTAYGLDAVLLLEAAVTAAVFLGFAAVARGLARRIPPPPEGPRLVAGGLGRAPSAVLLCRLRPDEPVPGLAHSVRVPVLPRGGGLPLSPTTLEGVSVGGVQRVPGAVLHRGSDPEGRPPGGSNQGGTPVRTGDVA